MARKGLNIYKRKDGRWKARYITLGEKVIASGSFDVETGEMGRNLYIYSPNQ